MNHTTTRRQLLRVTTVGGTTLTAAALVPRGIAALELDPWGKIERLTATWNGAYAGDTLLTAFAAKAIEY